VVRVPVEVTVVRLYTKSPGSHQLRKNAAAELAQMLAAGWSGDPEPIVDLLPTFGPPVTDLTE